MEEKIDLLQIFLEELADIEPIQEEEETRLLKELRGGNQSVCERLIEGNLKYAISFVKDYTGQGIHPNDMIAQINLALTNAVMNYKSGDLKSQIAAEIHNAMKMMISEENLAKSAKEELADRLNALSEEARVLALELGREATPEELAVRAGISQEEVSELMKITLNAMSREGQLK